jgi:diguanylate cyclase (GGDEF)-like protein
LPDDEGDEDRTKMGEVGVATRGARDRAHLIVLAGESLGQMFRVDQPEVVIGRAADAGIRVLDDGVSRRHARIALRRGQLWIDDLGSVNGTLINGQAVQSAVLRDGDKIQIGSTTILKFTYADELDEEFQNKMQQAALLDGLTKAYNKGHFLHRLESEVAYAKRHGAPLCLLMIDVDHFKAINDTHGHPAGDCVLVTLAQIVHESLRMEDVFARFGGEEFAVLCRGTTADDALTLAERLRYLIGAFSFDHQGRAIAVTVSVGAACWFDQPDSATRLIADADEALYKAKASGRNRVVVRAFR